MLLSKICMRNFVLGKLCSERRGFIIEQQSPLKVLTEFPYSYYDWVKSLNQGLIFEMLIKICILEVV